MQSIWHVHSADPARARELARALDVDPLTGQLLLNRGITTRADAVRFLSPTLQRLDDPRRLPDMERAVDRLRRAAAAREPILIFGDSDVDGLTASVILYETLRDLGADVSAKQSNRITDGYGLSRAVAQQICRSSTKLVILVDCGTNQPDEVRLFSAHGIDTIIVDHHVPLDAWAQPHALINPHRSDSRGVPGLGRELCSAGLAFKIAQALLAAEAPERLASFLDLAALGTLADCSPLVRESRIIVFQGLERIVRSRRPGLQRLCEATKTSAPDVEQVVRRLVPRLNASGRLGDSSAAWHLLGSHESERCGDWMASVGAAHATTKELHRQIFVEAQEQVNRLHFKDQYVMVVSRSGWHQGLMGSLASQLAQRYGRPAIAIAMDEHRGIGSGRSVPLFNLLDALRSCQELLVRFGGHAQACGLTVDRKHLEQFRTLVNHQARLSLGREGLLKTRMVDLELSLKAIARKWVEEAERLAPFGHGNPRATVVIRRVAIDVTSPRMAHLADGTMRVAAKGSFSSLVDGGRYDVVASPAVIAGELVLMVSDVRASAAPSAPARI